MGIKKEFFGKMNDGREADIYTLENKNGLRLSITNFGGRMVRFFVPDAKGNFDDIITGFDTLEPYLIRNPYFGALVGRYAGRISNAAFSLNGKKYNLDANQGNQHLHGGSKGFSNVLWNAEAIQEKNAGKLKLSLTSPDGDQGYPAAVHAEVIYTLADDNTLSLQYSAQTDADTPFNMTNHVYFNLKGHNKGDILNHKIRINADSFLPIDESGIPSANLSAVEGTPFDLRTMTEIKNRYKACHKQMIQQDGFDVYYFFDGKNPVQPLLLPKKVCEVEEPESGRKMEVFTTKPGMQFYTANKIKDNFTFTGKNGHLYPQYCGFCLETQFLPNGPNSHFSSSVILRPAEKYRHETIFAFLC